MQRYGQYPLQWGQFGNNGLGLNGLTLQEGVGYVPPAGYVFLVDVDGYYLVDIDGYYLLGVE